MCMACGCPLSSPFVSTETVAESPRSTTVASPLPVTWLVGTGAVAPLKDWPAGSAGVVVELEAVFLEDPPPLRAITATITPTITTSPTSAGSRYFLGELSEPSPPPALGPGGPSGGPTATGGGAAGGGAAGGDALAAVTAGGAGELGAVCCASPASAVMSPTGPGMAGLALVWPAAAGGRGPD